MSLPRSGFAATSNAGVHLIARSTIEACRALINDLHRADAALSDNSIQTTAKSLPAFLRSVGGKQESFLGEGLQAQIIRQPRRANQFARQTPGALIILRLALPRNFSSGNDG
jgi:hypothetical protein